MTTLVLLGAAACLSFLIGILLGMFAARRSLFNSFTQPGMDFIPTSFKPAHPNSRPGLTIHFSTV